MSDWSDAIETYLLLKKNLECLAKPTFEGQLKCILKANKTTKKKTKKKKKKSKRRYYGALD